MVMDVFTMCSEVSTLGGSCEPEVAPGVVVEYHGVGTVVVFCEC
jgi:hypothetical protein